MPTSATIVSNLRRFLDDFESSHRKGTQWSDDEIYLALNAAQFAVVRAFYVKSLWHLISDLETNISGASPLALPSDYMFFGSAKIESPAGRMYPATIYIGWSGREYDNDPSRYVAFVRPTLVTFRRGTTSASGEFSYWRRPTLFAAASNHLDFIDPVYDIIVWHAATILQQKDLGTCNRARKSIEGVLKVLMQQPASMYPQGMKEGRDA
jgi:hypothetical protein